MDALAPFRTFRTLEEARTLASELEELGFTPVLEDNGNFLSSAIVGAVPDYYVVKLPAERFREADHALETAAEKELSDISSDHYLFSFSTEELLDVARKPDEWNALDRRLAIKLLADRGLPMEEASLTHFAQARIEELAEPAKPQTRRVVIGYALAVLGGLMGIFIGHHLNTAKKTLPDGRRVYVYNDEDRSHGKWIFFLGVAMFLFVTYRYLAHLNDLRPGP